MAETRPVDRVQLFVGVLAPSEEILPEVKEQLIERLGPVDLESKAIPFDVTDYYEPEMGSGLQRWFLSFERLISPGEIVSVKLTTNEIEKALADDGHLGDLLL